jgi:hypothetical protein
MSDEELWSHIEYSERTAVVGLKAPGAVRGVYQGRLLLDRTEWLQACSNASTANTLIPRGAATA